MGERKQSRQRYSIQGSLGGNSTTRHDIADLMFLNLIGQGWLCVGDIGSSVTGTGTSNDRW